VSSESRQESTRVFRTFLVVDAIGFVVLGAICIAIGVPEAIPALIGGYFLGFQTGAES
jgi:hypothetical protein